MSAIKCARLSRIQKSREYAENRMIEALDRRNSNGKFNEDSNDNHLHVNKDGDRVWRY